MAWVYVGQTDGRDHWRDAEAPADCWLEADGSTTVSFKPMNDAEVALAVKASTGVSVTEVAPNVYDSRDASGRVVQHTDATGINAVVVTYALPEGQTREARFANLEQTLGLA